MKKSSRLIFFGTLLIGLIFAAGLWFMPYEWRQDPKARFKVEAVQIKRDHSYFWLDVHLLRAGAQDHSKGLPVWLKTSAGESIEPADVTFGSSSQEGVTEIWYRFWVPQNGLTGPVSLHMNEGDLTIRSGDGVPALEDGQIKVYRTKFW